MALRRPPSFLSVRDCFSATSLLEALPSNPYGHFEDKEVVGLHNQILADNDLTWLVGEPLLPVVTGEALGQDAPDRRDAATPSTGSGVSRTRGFVRL